MGPSLCAAHNQHDKFARLEEAERNGTTTKEDKIKLGEWKGGLSRGGALFLGVEGRLAQHLCAFPRGLFCSFFRAPHAVAPRACNLRPHPAPRISHTHS